LIHDKFIMQLEVADDDQDDEDDEDDESEGDQDEAMTEDGGKVGDDDSNDGSEDFDPLDMPPNEVILANKRACPLFRRLFRSKGEFFLATRLHRAGEWSQAGAMITLTGGRPWFCTLPPEQYLTGDEEVDKLVQFDIAKGGEWSDRRQEIVFIGEGLDSCALEAVLDDCLLTDEEYSKWVKTMRDESLSHGTRQDKMQDLFDDGFPDWSEDHEGHDHGHGSDARMCHL
jgi:G3E family GTPase